MKNSLRKRIKTNGLFQKALMSLAIGLSSLLSFAQTTYTVGNGAATNPNFPISSCYGYTYSQQIYTAADLAAQGAGIGTITKIRFFVSSRPATITASDNWKVYIGHTSKNEFLNTSDWEGIGNMPLAFSGTVVIPAAANWMEIVLTTPFEWDGTTNLIVGIEEEDPSYNCTINWKSTLGTFNRGIYYRSDSNNPVPSAPPAALGITPTMPNIQFDIIAAPVCSGVPAAGNTLATSTDVCATGSTVLSSSTNYFAAGIVKQWQVNDGSGWVNVNGATGSTLNQSNLADTMEYRMIAKCLNTGDSVITTPVTVNLQSTPVITLNESSIATCLGEPAMLISSGADTYSWLPATGLNVTSGDTVLASPTAISNYTVTGTSAFGCVSTNNPTVKVTPVILSKGTISYDPTEICAPNSPVTIELNNLPSTITSNGTWETRWLDADSVTVLQDWNVSNSFTFIPTSDAIYSHFYQIRSTSCPSDYVDSLSTSIAVGFGAEANLTHYDCNTMGGTIALFNEFGQPAMDTVFFDSLNVAYPGVLALTGVASFTGGRIQLTSSTSQTGSVTVNPGNITSSVGNNGMKFNFKMTADNPIVAWGFTGADGMAFSFGNDAVVGGVGPYQNGKGSKLRLSFDEVPNVNGNEPGIYLTYGFNGPDMAPTSPGVLAYSTNISLWKLLADVPVEISISAGGSVDVTVNGQQVFQNIQLPTSYTTEDLSTWKHLFTAQTGGAGMRHCVKDYQVETYDAIYGITDGGTATAPSTWQDASTFTDLLPGTYNVWMSKDGVGTCEKNIGTFEIFNNNPVVNLGNDTTICTESSLVLDAGNVGGVYIWSNSNEYTQTITVSEAGNYVVNVTDTNGCEAIGSIVVEVNDIPSASGIYAQGDYPTVTYSVLNAQNADSYAWDFGDGNTLSNGPSTISHTYTIDGAMIVTATLTNGCGSVDITETVQLINDASLSETSLSGLAIYPNPTNADFTVSLEDQNSSDLTVYSVTGAIVFKSTFVSEVNISTQNWEKGVYFVHVSNGGNTTNQKIVVQ